MGTEPRNTWSKLGCFIRAVLTWEDRETMGKEPQPLEDDGTLCDPGVAGTAPS